MADTEGSTSSSASEFPPIFSMHSAHPIAILRYGSNAAARMAPVS
jgi:hypothetical protein